MCNTIIYLSKLAFLISEMLVYVKSPGLIASACRCYVWVIKNWDSSLYILRTHVLVLFEFYLHTYCKRSFGKKLPQNGYLISNCSKYVLLLHRFIPIRIQKHSDRDTPHDSLYFKVILQFLWQVNKDIFREIHTTSHTCHIYGRVLIFTISKIQFYLAYDNESIMYSYDVIPMHFLQIVLFTGPYYKHFALLCKLAQKWLYGYKIRFMAYEIGIIGGTRETGELAATCHRYTLSFANQG